MTEVQDASWWNTTRDPVAMIRWMAQRCPRPDDPKRRSLILLICELLVEKENFPFSFWSEESRKDFFSLKAWAEGGEDTRSTTSEAIQDRMHRMEWMLRPVGVRPSDWRFTKEQADTYAALHLLSALADASNEETREHVGVNAAFVLFVSVANEEDPTETLEILADRIRSRIPDQPWRNDGTQ